MTPYSSVLMDLVESRLKWISVAQGYSFNMQSVQRYDVALLNTSVKPCSHLHLESESKVRSGSEWEVTLELGIWVFVDQLSTDSRETEVMEMEVGADIERMLCQLEEDEDFGASVMNLQTSLLSMSSEETVEHGVEVKVQLGYRVDFSDPRVPTVSMLE